uniref:Peptidase_M13 domain-containing protein n=1 Tax=Strongyloides venezuelensis TaxID=75913 RepID=A0A0K0G373_STRVS
MGSFILILYFYSLFFISKGSTPNKAVDAKTIYDPKFTSDSLRKYIDTDEIPCNNLYNFACGNWIKDRKRESKYLHYSFDYRPTTENFKSLIEETDHNDSIRGQSTVVDQILNLRGLCVAVEPFHSMHECRRVVIEFGTYALATLFINRNRKNSEERNDYIVVEDMVKRIKEEFIKLIDERRDTFDEYSINNVLHKFNNITFSIKSDDFDFTNVKLMEACYKNTTIDFHNATVSNIGDIVNAIKHQQSITKNENLMWTCREKIFNPSVYLKHHVYSTVKYHPVYNIIYISSDALTEPSFSIKFPNALNYGYLGFSIAQAILEGFDTKNINYNFNNVYPKKKQKSLMSEVSMNDMIEFSKCFTRELNDQRRIIHNTAIDDVLSTDNKLADNAGLKIAYRAYKNFVKSYGEENIFVPGFTKYSDDQFFFISFGRHFCEHTTGDNYVPYYDKPGKVLAAERTNSILKNYNEFSNTFHCEHWNSLLHTKTCQVW